MKIQDILKELGGQMGLPNLKLDENKVCRLIFDKKYTVDIEASEDEKTVHIYSAICIIPPEDREPLYQTLLEANLFGRGTGSAAFGIDMEMGEILLSSTVKLEKLDYQEFVNILESFVNHIETWTEKIDSRDYSKGGSRPRSDQGGQDLQEGPPPGYMRA